MRHGTILIPVLAWGLVPAVPAQESVSAAAVTAGGRSMAGALDSVLGGAGRGVPGPRSLLLLIDPSPALQQAGFVTELRTALQRNRARLAKTRIGVAGVGERGSLVLKPGADAVAVVRAVEGLLARPESRIRNVYQDIRAMAGALGAETGDRELILVALDNGDAEDNLEATLLALRREKVVFRCIASESYLADSYWAARPSFRAPSKCRLTGGDGAFVELPWGWLMQETIANEVAPSSFATYGFSRLAAETKGRVFLYSITGSGHRCSVYGSCLFCSNDHSPAGDMYWRARVSRYAPSTRARRQVYQQAAADPAFRAMLKAWQKGARVGLLRSSPSVKITGNGLTPQRYRGSRRTNLFLSTGFSRNASKALKLAKECERIRGVLVRELAAFPRSKGVPRYRAMAEYTVVMLQLTKVNLVSYAGWCKEIAPGLVAKSPPEFAVPEIDSVDRGRRAAGVAYHNYSLCHGARPFLNVELPGGVVLRRELEALDLAMASFENLYGHTPIAAGLHRSGIAHFRLSYPGIAGKRPRKKPRSSLDRDPLTERGRPARPGSSSGGTAGPTTGK